VVVLLVDELELAAVELEVVFAICCDVEDVATVEETGIKVVRVRVMVVEAVSVMIVTTVSVERTIDGWLVEVLPATLDCDPWSTPCSGLTIAIAKMRETITETAITDAKTSSNLSWRFKVPSGQEVSRYVMYCDRFGFRRSIMESCDIFLGAKKARLLFYYENLGTRICYDAGRNAS